MLFGIPPAVRPSALLSASKDVEAVELIAVERVVPDGRKVRWVVLQGSEGGQVSAVLSALVKAAREVVVVVADDDTWRLFAVASERGRLCFRFDDLGDQLRRQRPALSLKQRLSERVSEADAAEVSSGDVPHSFGTASWEYFVRRDGAGSSFAASESLGDDGDEPFADGAYALFWPDLYDWDVEEMHEDDAVDAPSEDAEDSGEPTKEGLIALLRSGTLKAERRLKPSQRRELLHQDPSRKKPGSAD